MENIFALRHDLFFYLQLYLDRYPLLFPLGFIGIWRWGVWVMKEVVGSNYHPNKIPYNADIAIVTPVYNEDPKIFPKVLESWKKNNPKEIIAVIDYTDKACIEIFEKFSKEFSGAKLIITKVPGKRAALGEGIKVAKSEIIALVDSDTFWDERLLKNALPPFNDKKVAGVATYQNVLNPKTLAQKIFDIQLDLRYHHEYPFLAAAGDALVCLSGRTAIYRRSVISSMVHDLVNEKFMGKPVISGDDKRLTYLVLAAGWKVAFQSNAHVYTPGMPGLGQFLKQRLRWTRNSLRADIKALLNGWPLRRPALLFFQIDKLLQSFVLILSPIFFLVAIYYKEWIPAVVIVIWWIISRSLKMYHHLGRRPQDVSALPAFILFSFANGIMKIYALFTLNTQGWITRWDKSRLPQLKFLGKVPAYVATATVVVGLFYLVNYYKQQTYFKPLSQKQELIASALRKLTNSSFAVLGASTSEHKFKDLHVKVYTTKKGNTIASVANKFGLNAFQLLYANEARLPLGTFSPGTKLSIPPKEMRLVSREDFYSDDQLGLKVVYDKETNTVLIVGRGKKLSFSDLVKLEKEHFENQGSEIWYAKASIFVSTGVTLTFDKKDVRWLKLKSDESGFVSIRARNGDISFNGVKVTSWDKEKNDYDKNYKGGRSFVMVRDNSRMDIHNSELAYLGFEGGPEYSVSPYGVAWKLSSQLLHESIITGEVIDSKFHHNYFGAYTYGATGMTWRGNEFYNNVRYGLDPHDDSNGFLVENNSAHDNGSHGIIFSKRCMYNTIRNNLTYNNTLHGIMLHEKSDNNIIERNTIVGNVSGIALYRSSNNIVRDNDIRDNRHGIRANVDSDSNLIQSNKVIASSLYGIYFYDSADKNLIVSNEIRNNDVGIYIKTNDNQITNNSLYNNFGGIYLVDKASQNVLSGNQIKQSLAYGIYTKVAKDISNSLDNNNLVHNRKDIVGE